MRAAHAGFGIGDAQFDRVVDHLKGALTDLGVSTDLVTRVIAGLEPLRSEIVTEYLFTVQGSVDVDPRRRW